MEHCRKSFVKENKKTLKFWWLEVPAETINFQTTDTWTHLFKQYTYQIFCYLFHSWEKMKFLQDLARDCVFLAEILQDLDWLLLLLPVSFKILCLFYEIFASSHFFKAQTVSDIFLSFPLQNCSKSLAVDSETSVSCRFIRQQEWSFPKWRDKVTLEKNCFNLFFYSDRLSHYKTYDFRKLFIPDAFKHVLLQNTFNRCKVPLIWFGLLFGEMHKLSERNVYTENFLLKRSYKNLARIEFFVGI